MTMSVLLDYPSSMPEPKGTGGRPPGIRYPKRLLVYCTEQDLELLQAIADDWDLSQAGAVRKLIRDEAKKRGLLDGAE
jgi:hypothetical protein